MKEKIELEQGRIYFLSYGGGTQIVGRFKNADACHYNFYDLIHYWNGYESFKYKTPEYCVKNGIEEIRPATLPEKHSLIKFELEYNCI